MTTSFAARMNLHHEAEDVFIGAPSPEGGSLTYGGQLLAQSLTAAQRTVTDDRAVHSVHSYFLKAADAAQPVELRVDRLRDGRSFSQRQVVALQYRAELSRSLISFQAPEEGLDWQEPATIDVPPPTSEQPYTDYDDFTESMLSSEERPWPGRGRPIDARYVNPPTAPQGQPVTESQRMWVRIADQLGDKQAIHDAGLLYLADTGMNAAMPLPHGYRWPDERITAVSLDHTMWFHRRARADEWLYVNQRVESTSHGRGLTRSRFYAPDGHLVATCMQEGLIRWHA